MSYLATLVPSPSKETSVTVIVLSSVPSVPGSCDFEVDTCGYSHDVEAEFQWTNNTGSTPSSHTGPAGDHTTGSGE